jgi:hypothetical protein
MKYFRDRKIPCCRVEQRLPIPGKFVTKDAFGFGDLLVILDRPTLVQVTTTGNLNAREKKLRAIPEHKKWLNSTGWILMHGWAKRGPRGQRRIWTLTEREITTKSTVEEEM